MNLTINVSTPTNFKANIKSTKFLQKGLKIAARDIESNPKRAQAFYESLNIILKNTKYKKFSIIPKQGSKINLNSGRPSWIKVDKLCIEWGACPAFGMVDDGEQCVESVIGFVKNFLGKKLSKTLLNKEELITESKFWEELIFSKKTKTY